MRVAAVTVTYNNRAHFLQKVVEGLVRSGVDTIVIVDNGSPEENFTILSALAEKYSKKIHLLRLDQNTGSANGYKTGIEYVVNNLVEDFIWLLDDDNYPEPSALQELKSFWLKLETPSQSPMALLSFRNDRPNFKKAVQVGDPYFVLGPKNSFLGFHVFNLFSNKDKLKGKNQKSHGTVAVAPYGGLFFNKCLISLIGLPDPKFYLYGDDYDFSYKITAYKGRIELVCSSIIQDLETSFHLKKDKKTWNRFFKTDSKVRIYYSVRNGIWFEKKNFVDNTAIYITNGLIYMSLLSIQFLLQPKHLSKLKIIVRGVIAGLKGAK